MVTRNFCGDRILNLAEACDDGNLYSRDGCSPTCQLEYLPFCGNGSLNPGEECDDGNLRNGDGCTTLCRHEIYSASCHNGRLETARSEQCDDGNALAGDGCSPDCRLEASLTCGDGVVQADREQCDTGPSMGYGPSACRPNCIAPYCGDRVLDFNEQCDDGNNYDGDGCSAICEREFGAPSTPTVASITPMNPDGTQVIQGTVYDRYGRPVPSPIQTKTGPGLVVFLASGAAAGIGFARRKLRRS